MAARFENGQMVFDVDPERYKRMLLAGIRSDPYAQQPKTAAEEDALVASAIAMQNQAAQEQAQAQALADQIAADNLAATIIAGNAYDPPYSEAQIRSRYPEAVANRLLSDPAHLWRATSGIELMHREPTADEFNRIWENWQRMSDEQKAASDAKSRELFGRTNKETYDLYNMSYPVRNDPYEPDNATYIPLDQLMQYGTTSDPYEYDRSLYFPADAEVTPDAAYAAPLILADAMVGRPL